MFKGMESSDDQLIQAMIALQPRLRRFAYGLSGSLEEADELVQCTYERALTRLEQWQAGTRLDSWLYRMLQNLWLNQLRAKRVRGEHLPREDVEEQIEEGQQTRLEASLILDRVRQHIARLPEDQRVALLLVSVEGLSYKEAADVLEVPVGTLTSRLSRGRQALIQLMGMTTPVLQSNQTVGK